MANSASVSVIDEALQACQIRPKCWVAALDDDQRKELDQLKDEHKNGRLRAVSSSALARFIKGRFNVKSNVDTVRKYLQG